MKMRQAFYVILASLLFFSQFAQAAYEEDKEIIKRKMIQRQPKIQKMWKEGLVGENNQGYLIPKEALTPEQQSVVNAENNDRLVAYKSIARHSNTDAETVGRARAASLGERASKGLWIQTPEGKWMRKQ